MSRQKAAYLNRIHRINAVLNIIIIYILCAFIIYYVFGYERNILLQANREAAAEINQYYQYQYDQFWSVYMPAFLDEEDTGRANVFTLYADTPEAGLDRSARTELYRIVRKMASTSNDIVGLLLHKLNTPEYGYLYMNRPGSLELLNISRQPFAGILPALTDRNTPRALLGAYPYTGGGKIYLAYGIAGTLPTLQSSSGSLTALYDISRLDNLLSSRKLSIAPHLLLLSNEGQVIFDSAHSLYGHTADLSVFDAPSIEYEGQLQYLDIIESHRGGFTTYCLSPVKEINRLAHKYTPMILSLCSFCALLALVLHLMAGHLSARRINRLNAGIARIGKNDLSFRFQVSSPADEFDSIGMAINEMSENLLRHREALRLASEQRVSAELRAIQARFNPHFLYNTLECIRVRLSENGDEDSAEMIRMLAYIFKGFVKSDPFVSVHEEISFINIYLDLYRLRYADAFKVYYAIDPKVRNLGVMRNLLQPVVENYFTHGFIPDRDDNSLTISAVRTEDDFLLLSVENNGFPIDQTRLETISQGLEDDAASGHYGLFNIQQRIRHFYGSECGLTLESRKGGSTLVRIRIRPMTLAEHEIRLKVLAESE